MKILGVVDGIGSMMIGARGFHEIIGNIEWRSYYHTGTFEANFPGAFMVKKWGDLTEDQLERTKDLDLVIGHPECGSYSRLNTTGSKALNKMDIPFFQDIVNKTQPKFFVADNLPNSLLSVPLKEWYEMIPGYKIELAWVSNYNYGNTQKRRNRLFVIGSRKDLDFTFIPGEFLHDRKLIDVINDLPDYSVPDINHIFKEDDDKMLNLSSHYFELEGKGVTYKQFRERIMNYVEGRNLCYYNKAGNYKKKPGYNIMRLDHYSPTMDGYENKYREGNLQPLTIRERARVQGIPDDFIFYPIRTERPADLQKLIKQTGKCMPVEFCTYLVDQIGHFIDGVPFETTGKSYLKPNILIQENIKECVDLL